MALQPNLWPSFWRCLGAIDSEHQAHTPDNFRVTRFTFDVFHTIMFKAEAMMNSRNITNVSDALKNEELLTPNHFLLQRPHNSLPPGVPSTKPASMKSWKNVKQFLNHIWRRLVREYLPTLVFGLWEKWTKCSPEEMETTV